MVNHTLALYFDLLLFLLPVYHFDFDFDYGSLVLIASVPVHCLSFTFRTGVTIIT